MQVEVEVRIHTTAADGKVQEHRRIETAHIRDNPRFVAHELAPIADVVAQTVVKDFGDPSFGPDQAFSQRVNRGGASA